MDDGRDIERHRHGDTFKCYFTMPAHAEPESPTDPERSGGCRWEHRFAGFNAADAGVLRVWTRKKGARVLIEAWNRKTGETVPVRDYDTGETLTDRPVTLAGANTVSRFSIPEGQPGNQRVLVVSHAEHVNGMRAITALMGRRTDGTPQVIQPDVVEHCQQTPSARVE